MGRALWSIVAVLAGYVTLGLIELLFSVAMIAAFPAQFVDPAGQPRLVGDWWFLLDLVFTFLAATVGALVTWRLAPGAHVAHLGALVALMTVISVATVVGPGDVPPAWWTMGELFAGAVAVFGVAAWSVGAAQRRGPAELP
jgi:hypothetical protein